MLKDALTCTPADIIGGLTVLLVSLLAWAVLA